MKERSRLATAAGPVIALLLVLLLYQYGYERIGSEMASTRELEKAKMKTLEKYMSAISEGPSLQKRLSSLRERRKADESKFIGSETVTLSAAALSDTVKGLVSGAGGSVSSERVDKAEDLGRLKVVNVGMDATLPDVRSLTTLVYGIETRVPYIVVREADVRVTDFRDPRQLMVRLRVAALAGGK